MLRFFVSFISVLGFFVLNLAFFWGSEILDFCVLSFRFWLKFWVFCFWVLHFAFWGFEFYTLVFKLFASEFYTLNFEFCNFWFWVLSFTFWILSFAFSDSEISDFEFWTQIPCSWFLIQALEFGIFSFVALKFGLRILGFFNFGFEFYVLWFAFKILFLLFCYCHKNWIIKMFLFFSFLPLSPNKKKYSIAGEIEHK